LLSLLYGLSGVCPIGYHLFNTALFASAIALLYVVLREIELPDATAFAIAVVYAFLPHYSTDRFWVAAFQANLSMAFCFLAFYSGLKSLRIGGIGGLRWTLASMGSLLASLFSYETTAGIFLALPLVLWWRGRTLRNPWKAAKVSIPIIVVLLLAVWYKAALRTHFLIHPHLPYNIVRILRHTVWECFNFNFLQYGFHLPSVLQKVFAYQPGRGVLLLAAAIAIGLFLNLKGTDPDTTARVCAILVFVGLLIWCLGFGLFAQSYDSNFATTGVNNRVCNASALGTSFILVGIMGLASGFYSSIRIRRGLFCAMVTFICVSGLLIINTLSNFWIIASREQRSVISDIRLHVPQLPVGSTLLLNGICRYTGPGIVFEASWDLAGVLRMRFHDFTLHADVVNRKTQVTDQGIKTELYGETSTYSYSKELLIYDYRQKILAPLTDRQTAAAYFRGVIPEEGCPAGDEGYGAKVF
jgi:hypothetical protein